MRNNKHTEESDWTFEMENYGTEVTGHPMMVWAGVMCKTKHGPRIRVQNSYVQHMDPMNTFIVTISDDPKIV